MMVEFSNLLDTLFVFEWLILLFAYDFTLAYALLPDIPAAPPPLLLPPLDDTAFPEFG